jgi:hypothetical protein
MAELASELKRASILSDMQIADISARARNDGHELGLMMAKLGEVRFPVAKALQSMTLQVRVTGLRRFRIRVWLGIRLLKLAAWVIGTGINIELPNGPTDGA